jgi:hypothetical protein
MTPGDRFALALLAISLLVSPAVTLHPAVTHVWAAGFSNAIDELGHPGLLTFLLLGTVSTIPAIGFVLCMLHAVAGRQYVRALWDASEPAHLGDLHYRRLPSGEVPSSARSFRPLTVSRGAGCIAHDALLPLLLRRHRRHRDPLAPVLRGLAVDWRSAPAQAGSAGAPERMPQANTPCALAQRQALFDAIVAAKQLRPEDSSWALGTPA